MVEAVLQPRNPGHSLKRHLEDSERTSQQACKLARRNRLSSNGVRSFRDAMLFEALTIRIGI